MTAAGRMQMLLELYEIGMLCECKTTFTVIRDDVEHAIVRHDPECIGVQKFRDLLQLGKS